MLLLIPGQGVAENSSKPELSPGVKCGQLATYQFTALEIVFSVKSNSNFIQRWKKLLKLFQLNIVQ